MENNQNLPCKQEDIVVFIILTPSVCAECGADLSKGSFLKMEKDKPLCLGCADLDHLEYLQSGDVALTRRSRKYSTLSAVVLKFSRSRRRYERQGLLVEPLALLKAEHECKGDAADRKLTRERAAILRERAEKEYVATFSKQICSQYPDCPVEEAETIAEHACLKYSGRVGRSASAKAFDLAAIELAVKAHIRHRHTNYDQLLSTGWERTLARLAVVEQLDQVIQQWSRIEPVR